MTVYFTQHGTNLVGVRVLNQCIKKHNVLVLSKTIKVSI